MIVKVALGQTHIIFGDPKNNLTRCQEWCKRAAGEGNDILILPELFLTGYDYKHLANLASKIDQGYFAEMAQLAMTHQMMLIGSLIEEADGKYYNTQCVYDATGSLIAHYRKLHLFGPMHEDQWFTQGAKTVNFKARFGVGGLAVCYDLRFPELFRRYALDQVAICFLCAEWPAARLAHWLTLNQARAIENQFFMVAVNAVGHTGKASFAGHSLVCDPWGQIILDAGETETLATAQLDLDMIAEVRQRIPALANRRPEVYGL